MGRDHWKRNKGLQNFIQMKFAKEFDRCTLYLGIRVR